MRTVVQKLLRKIPFANRPGIEEMLDKDDFSKYTQGDLDYFEDILIQCSEDGCKEMIHSYFKVLSGLVKKNNSDGFFGKIVGLFRGMLQNKTQQTDDRHEEDGAVPSKKRKRKSSIGVSKRIKRQDTPGSTVGIPESSWVCTDDGNAYASHAFGDSSTNASERACLEHTQNVRTKRRTMSYGYCPEDLVGKPISPDLFTRALNPEYNFLPGLPKLILGDIPTDDEEEYFRSREYLSSFSDEGVRCNFDDGMPYNCKKCAEKEYVEKMESLGLLERDTRLLDVVADEKPLHVDGRGGEDVHPSQEKRRRIAGKYYVDWDTKVDIPGFVENSACENSLGSSEVHGSRKSAAESVLGGADATAVENTYPDHGADKVDAEARNERKGDVFVPASHVPLEDEKVKEVSRTPVLGLADDIASKAVPSIPDENVGYKMQETGAFQQKDIQNAAHVEARPPRSILTGAVLESIPSKVHPEQKVSLFPLLSVDMPKSNSSESHSRNCESAHQLVSPDIITTEGQETLGWISGTVEKGMVPSAGALQEHNDISQMLQQNAATKVVEEPETSAAVPQYWNSTPASSYKTGNSVCSPAKKRDLQTMQSHGGATKAAASVFEKDGQGSVPFSCAQEGTTARASFLNNTNSLASILGSAKAPEENSENTQGAPASESSRGEKVESGHQGVPSFANLFDTSVLGTAANQPFVPAVGLFGHPNDENSRPSKEGQDVASRFNRRKR